MGNDDDDRQIASKALPFYFARRAHGRGAPSCLLIGHFYIFPLGRAEGLLINRIPKGAA
jgi:hypothetical protein